MSRAPPKTGQSWGKQQREKSESGLQDSAAIGSFGQKHAQVSEGKARIQVGKRELATDASSSPK